MSKNMLIKAEATTDPAYGVLPHRRSIPHLLNTGVINLDKPAGPTSHEVVSWVKKILGIPRAGHSGTLDPKVTGVQPIMLSDATKAVGALLTSKKEYVTILQLHASVSESNIRKVTEEFVGEIYQKPPIKSAVARRLRTRHVYYIDILEIDGNQVLMRVGTEAGTYIRKLCHDIGEALGVSGHMAELRRTKTGPFTEDTLFTLHDVKDAYVFWQEDGDETMLREVVQPMEKALTHLPAIVIRDTAVDAIAHGADLAAPGVLQVQEGIKENDMIVIYTLKGEAVALANSMMNAKDILRAREGVVADTKRVLIQPGTYPRVWGEPATQTGNVEIKK